MWIVFGVVTVLSAAFNIVWTISKKDAKWFRFVSTSFTSLTVCAFYWDSSLRVTKGDWTGLEDTMPTLSTILWIGVILSIVINSISLFAKNR